MHSHWAMAVLRHKPTRCMQPVCTCVPPGRPPAESDVKTDSHTGCWRGLEEIFKLMSLDEVGGWVVWGGAFT